MRPEEGPLKSRIRSARGKGAAKSVWPELHGTKRNAKVGPAGKGAERYQNRQVARKAPNCTGKEKPLRLKRSPGGRAEKREARVRLILENSTVCHSRRISLLCPVDWDLIATCGVRRPVDGFFGKTMILAIMSVSSCQASLFLACRVFGSGVWVLFSTESLILAQDERWRRA